MPLDINNREAFAEAVRDKSDEEIIGLGNESDGGIVGLLDQMFEGMAGGFRPENAGDKAAVIQYEITTPEGVRAYSLDVKDGKCTLTKGPADSPRITLVVTFPDWMRMASQVLDGMKAFTSGKLKIRGDLMFAQTMQNWFDTSEA